LDLGYLFKEYIFSVTKINTMSSKTKKHRPNFLVAVKRRLKLWEIKPKAEKEKGALEKHFNRTTSENAQDAQEEPHHREDGDSVDS